MYSKHSLVWMSASHPQESLLPNHFKGKEDTAIPKSHLETYWSCCHLFRHIQK